MVPISLSAHANLVAEMPTSPSQSLLRLRTGTALAFSVMATVMFAFEGKI